MSCVTSSSIAAEWAVLARAPLVVCACAIGAGSGYITAFIRNSAILVVQTLKCSAKGKRLK